MNSAGDRRPRRHEQPAATRPRVLVLMATFNGTRWIEQQLDSIVAQRDVEITVMVRDDASTDGTDEAVRSYAARQAVPFRIERSEQASGSAGQNFFRLMQCADATGCDFVALADQDDVWNPGKLARAVACLESGDAVGYSASVRAFWPDGREAVLSQSPASRLADYVFEGAGQGCTFVLRATEFTALQRILDDQRALLEALHYHDWTLYALCRARGRGWHFDAQACMRYRQHSENDTGARTGAVAIGKRLVLIRSGWYDRQVAQVARLCDATTAGAAPGARRYLMLTDADRHGPLARLRVAAFVLQNGRRRAFDRLILAWAALRGYLGSRHP